MSRHSRRAILAGIATTPALAGPALALGSSVGPDPIFAKIDRHRIAMATHFAAGEAQDAMEERVVDENLKQAGSPAKCSDQWFDAVRAIDCDPRYAEAKEKSCETSDAEIEAAWQLVAEPPTTIAGAAALVAYALGYHRDYLWPDDKEDSHNDFAVALLRSLHSALRGEAVS
jgi:hypothetical protein